MWSVCSRVRSEPLCASWSRTWARKVSAGIVIKKQCASAKHCWIPSSLPLPLLSARASCAPTHIKHPREAESMGGAEGENTMQKGEGREAGVHKDDKNNDQLGVNEVGLGSCSGNILRIIIELLGHS